MDCSHVRAYLLKEAFDNSRSTARSPGPASFSMNGAVKPCVPASGPGRRSPALSASIGSLPHPGGRHPRAGFPEGAIDPLRGTKASFFLAGGGYAAIDLPQAIFSNLGLIFLAHTHVPTIWNRDNVASGNVDWVREPGGSRGRTGGCRTGSNSAPRQRTARAWT